MAGGIPAYPADWATEIGGIREKLNATAASAQTRVGYTGGTLPEALTVLGLLTASGGLTVTGALATSGGLTVGGAATVTGALTASGGATIAGLTVTGGGTVAGGLNITSGGANIAGGLTVASGGLNVTGATVMDALTADSVTTGGALQANSANVTGNTTTGSLNTGAANITGALNHDGGTLGFYGAAPMAQANITGSRDGNAALASLLTALDNRGLINNSTTA